MIPDWLLDLIKSLLGGVVGGLIVAWFQAKARGDVTIAPVHEARLRAFEELGDAALRFEDAISRKLYVGLFEADDENAKDRYQQAAKEASDDIHRVLARHRAILHGEVVEAAGHLLDEGDAINEEPGLFWAAREAGSNLTNAMREALQVDEIDARLQRVLRPPGLIDILDKLDAAGGLEKATGPNRKELGHGELPEPGRVRRNRST